MAASDVLRAKTNAELLYFVENPAQYERELVAAARQELRRRQRETAASGAASTAVGTQVAAFTEEAPSPNSGANSGANPGAGGRWLAGAALLLALGGAGWLWQRGSAAQQQATDKATAAANRPGRLLPDSLKLETAVSAPLPASDPDQDADRQLALVPAAERAQASAQALRQFRGLSLRFWRAQNPTAYLVGQAARPHSAQVLLAQLGLAQGQWTELNRGLAYSYAFPPVMADQVARMRAIASIQRRTLTELQSTQERTVARELGDVPLVLTPATQQEQAEARRLLAPLQRYVAPMSVRLKG